MRRVLSLWALVFVMVGASSLPADAQVSTRRTRTVLAIERVKNAVVAISTDQYVKTRNPDALDETFERYFRESETLESLEGDTGKPLGSGVLIDPAGYVLTSYRVISRGARLRVTLDNGRHFVASVVGTAPESDIAVLKIDGQGAFPFALMGSSDDLMVGETVIALGNPFGNTQTVSVGIVSSLNRGVRVGERSYYGMVQTDAGVHPGNAGGPLVNGDGELLGIASALTLGSRNGYGIPIERAKRIALELIRSTGAPLAHLGFDVATVTADISRFLGVEASQGACIVGLESRSPAEASGLKVGDVITRVGQRPVSDAQAFVHLIRDLEIGKEALLEVHRGKEKRTLSVKAAAFPLERAEALFARKLGAAVIEGSGSEGRKLSPSGDESVKIRVVMSGSLAERAGLAPGDVIRAVNSHEVSKLSDFRQAVARARRSGIATLLIQRGFQLEQIPIDFY